MTTVVATYKDVRDTGEHVTRQCQLVLKRMLFVFVDVCVDHDIDYCLHYQTLCDAFHDHGFSPCSSTVHVAVRHEDVPRLKVALQKNMPSDMFFQDSETDPTFTSKMLKLRDRYSNYYEWSAKAAPNVTWHNGLQLDIYPYEHVGQRTRVNIVNEHRVRSTILFRDGKYTTMFEGRPLRTPKHVDRFLVSLYGNLDRSDGCEPIDGKANPFEPCAHPASNLGTFKLPSCSAGSKKRLLLMLPHLLAGGATRMAIEVVKQLKTYGWSVWCVETIPPAAGWVHWNDRIAPYCVECVHIPRKHHQHLCQLIASNNITLIWSLAPIAVTKIKASVPHVKIVDQHFNEVHLAHHKKHAHNIDHVVVCYDALAKEFAVPTTSIWVGIPPATRISARQVTAWKAARGLQHVTLPIVSFVGRFSVEKRPQWIVDIALSCKGLATVIAAGEGPLYESVVADNEARGAGVVFLGHVEQPEMIYEVSSVIFIPSEIEGLPNTMMEAIQRGKHVVITPVGGVPHWKSHGLVHICEHSSDDFADTIKTLIAAKAVKERVSFPDEWTAVEMGKRYDETFSDVLGVAATVELLQNVHFINLDKRTDRLARITKQIASYQGVTATVLQVERFPAILRRPGFVGCSESHLKLLKDCLAHSRTAVGHPYYTVLEDDFEWKATPFGVKSNLDLLCSSELKWDVLILAASKWYFKCGPAPLLPTKEGGFYKAISCSTTTGYVVRAAYLPKLVANFEQSTHFIRRKENHDKKNYHKYALDQFWKSLQAEDDWIFHKPGFAKQADTFSDIENKTMTYDFF